MKMKKQLLALLLAAVMVLSLTGCKETLKKVAQKVRTPPAGRKPPPTR
jgi:uncharacterized lipoprotein YehR (DUF1307 family)